MSQTARLAGALARIAPPDLVLLQTPPSVPAGPLAWAVARARGARMVLDWHNLGWTILALKIGDTRSVAALRAAERWLGGRADAHLCVSRSLRDHLARTLGVDAAVVYDRPPSWFAPVDVSVRNAFRSRLFASANLPPDGAVLIVSPTSWTADEDLGLLVDTADRLEAMRATMPGLPPMLMLVSGSGPGRAAFEARIARRPADTRVRIATGWFEPGEYPTLLGSADAGVCLHRSSSGLDLPMKIADMFGVGLPVIALRYPAIAERISDGHTGLLFDDAPGLATILAGLWNGGRPSAQHARLREGSASQGGDRWLEGWNREAAPLLGLGTRT